MATPPSTTVLKAFDLLELFAERPLLGAGEAARLLGAPRASTHRLLVTLRLAGVLEANGDGQYRLGLRLFELGSNAPLRRRLHDEATQPLERLSAQVALPALLAARDGTDLLCLEKVYHRQTDVPTRVGQRAPLHSTAVGKVLLAYAPRAVIERYLSEPAARFTPHTIVEPRRLLMELERIRDRGLAWEREESCLGVASVATGIWNHTGKIVAAISVSAATLPDCRRLKRAERPLLATAAEIHRRLGWTPSRETASERVPAPA
ncbi:MAG: helix-turn-helix domain-containing protein [Propionibacteriales bacterium]|nr:helix-turn-helix domain-containing protein [Propionibacteriales bacterium]